MNKSIQKLYIYIFFFNLFSCSYCFGQELVADEYNNISFPQTVKELRSADKMGGVIVITRNINLLGESINLPEKCVLIFDGGSFYNGIIVMNNALVLSNYNKSTDCFKCEVIGSYSFKQLTPNKGIFLGSTSGPYNNGVVLSAISNSNNPDDESKICGFVDGLTTSRYSGRDAVAVYAENNNPAPIVVYNSKFNGDKIILPSDFDLSRISVGDYVDVFNNGYTIISEGDKIRWTSIVDSIDYKSRIIRVKYGGFYKVKKGGSEIAETPVQGSVVYFKLTTKIWSINSMVISRPYNGNTVKNLCGYELDVSNNDENCYAQGMTVVSIGKVKGDIAYDVEGRWDAGYLARNPWVSFYSRDYGDGTQKYVLLQERREKEKYSVTGYIDNNFVYHQGAGYIDLNSENPCVQTKAGSILFSKDNGTSIVTEGSNYNFSKSSFKIPNHSWKEGLVVLGDYSLWINEGKLYVKNGTPNNATDGKQFQENSSGLYRDRPRVDVAIGDIYFCTDKSTPESGTEGIALFYKGDGVWVDALGRIVR